MFRARPPVLWEFETLAVEFQRGTLTGETKQEQCGPKAKKQYLKSITFVQCCFLFFYICFLFSSFQPTNGRQKLFNGQMIMACSLWATGGGRMLGSSLPNFPNWHLKCQIGRLCALRPDAAETGGSAPLKNYIEKTIWGSMLRVHCLKGSVPC